VAFNDRLFAGDKDATLVQWNKIFNAEKLTEEPFKGSVHDYFLDQSYGEFNVVFDLTYVQVGDDAKKYASTYSDDENSQYLVQDIMEILKQDPDIDWGKYDWNGDGYINQLLIVYAGQGMNDYNTTEYTEMIWAHQWWMSEHLKDNQEDVYCEPIPVSSGGKDYLVDCYCALPEMGKNNTYSTFGTICHEYTHCFGFPDFYYNGVKTLDQWDLMDSGNFNAGGFIPPGYSAHERWVMGWLTPIELKEETTITDMPALTDEGRAYLVRNDGYENEYYIVENRQPKGWDAGLPGSGILVFHIDYDPAVWASSSVYTNTEDIMRYDLFHANEKYDEGGDAGWAYPYQDNDKLTNTSTPAATLYHNNSDGTNRMSKPITNMKVTDGLASFDFMVVPNPPGLMTPPENLVTEEWAISAKDTYDDPVSGYLNIGFDGNDVYLQGLCAELPKAWIKGTLDGTTITFAGDQYLGVYDGGQFFYYEFFLCHEGATFTYDAAAGKLTAEGEIYIYTGGSNLKADVYINPVISKVVEKAATPAMPDISEIYDSFTGPIVFFTIPTVDVNGDAMASSKLEFQFLKEVDQEITPVTFSPDNYLNLPVPMDIIPYGFTDDADFFDIYIYFKQPDFNTWKKIGLQAIYNGAGECHKSDIFWMENPFFTNGISEVMPDMKSDKTLIFNLAGQRLTAPRKGLNIINGKKVMVK
jgi:M6 family metalloprotease-like protein